jgi:PPOX class probable F420-dependent enzyme
MLDPSEPHHAHIDARLRTEPIIWLTTASSAGRPHVVPMWFFCDGRSVLLFSLPNTRKLRNIAANPAVVLALNAADQGYDIVVIDGTATLVDDPALTGLMPEFVAKYAAIPRRWPPGEWAEKFTQAIRVTPTRLIARKGKPGDPSFHTAMRF